MISRPRRLRRRAPLIFLILSQLFTSAAAGRDRVELGVCFHHGAYGDEYTPASAAVLDDLRAAGPFWIRGDYEDPAKDAPFVADMARKGIRVLALLPWYSRDIAGWPALVRKEAHAVPGVDAWEIANEPEMSWWGGPIAPGDYMKMLRDAHAIIRSAQPDARIVAPAVGATAEGVAYLEKLIDLGLLEYVDAISVHYYVFHKSQQLEAVKQLVAGRKPIWITETGWTTADQQGGEEAQRRYVEEYYDPDRGILGADPAIELIFNYQLNDEHYPAPPDKDSGWGLTYGPEGGFGKKAAYHEFRKLLTSGAP
jgi:Glycosyl hydrolase catalytic core